MRFAIFSTMHGQPWGGSEELWSRAAAVLLERGHQVSINYRRQSQPVAQLARLQDQGAEVHWRRRPIAGRSLRRAMEMLHLGRRPFVHWLRSARPDFVLISVGHHLDNTAVTQTCRQLGIPYGLLVQAASPYHWIEPRQIDEVRAAYAGAARTWFVSEQNRQVLESNLALDLSDGEIVDNAFNVRPSAAPAWPTPEKYWKLACVGRLHFEPKGQDLLLNVLRRSKWRSRPLQIVLWGADAGNRRQIERIIALYALHKQVSLGGFAGDVETLWSQHHGLVLPSRFEGNALSMIEAMLCGRVPIVTNVGRAGELIDDNRTGFVAPAPTTELIDDALERAWQRRHEWQAMGALAAADIRRRHSLRPAEDFAGRLLAVPTRVTRRAAA